MQPQTPILNVSMTTSYFTKPLNTQEDIITHGLGLYFAQQFIKEMYITIDGRLLPGYRENVDEINAQIFINPQIQLLADYALQQTTEPISLYFTKQHIEVYQQENELYIPRVQTYLSQLQHTNQQALRLGILLKRELLQTPLVRIPTKKELAQKKKQRLLQTILEKTKR